MDKVERKAFNKLKRLMAADGLYKKSFDLLIERAAILMVMVDKAKEQVEEKGFIQSYKTSARACSPELNNYRGLCADLLKYLGQLGLSPQAQHKLKSVSNNDKPKSRLMSLRKAK